MHRPVKHLIILTSLELVLVILVGRNTPNSSEGTLSIEQFQSQMNSKDYSFVMKFEECDCMMLRSGHYPITVERELNKFFLMLK